MSDNLAASTAGAQIKATKKGVEATVSDQAIASAERMWLETLAWTERNPILFVVVLIILLIAFVVWIEHRRESRPMRRDYRNRRAATKLPPKPGSAPPPKPEKPRRRKGDAP